MYWRPLRPVYVSIVTVAGVSPSLYVQLTNWVVHYDTIGGTGWPEGTCDILENRGVKHESTLDRQTEADGQTEADS